MNEKLQQAQAIVARAKEEYRRQLVIADKLLSLAVAQAGNADDLAAAKAVQDSYWQSEAMRELKPNEQASAPTVAPAPKPSASRVRHDLPIRRTREPRRR